MIVFYSVMAFIFVMCIFGIWFINTFPNLFGYGMLLLLCYWGITSFVAWVDWNFVGTFLVMFLGILLVAGVTWNISERLMGKLKEKLK